MNSISSNSLILNKQRFAQSGCEDIRIRKSEFVAITQFLSTNWLEFLILEYLTELKISKIYELVWQILKYAEIPKIRELNIILLYIWYLIQ